MGYDFVTRSCSATWMPVYYWPWQGERDSNVTNGETRVARAIYDALTKFDPTACVLGEPGVRRTLIDGTFDLEVIAKMVLWDIRDMLHPVERVDEQLKTRSIVSYTIDSDESAERDGGGT